jgi:hypothetical protein
MPCDGARIVQAAGAVEAERAGLRFIILTAVLAIAGLLFAAGQAGSAYAAPVCGVGDSPGW